MTSSSEKVTVKWVNNVTGLVCVTLANGDTCLVHRMKLSVGDGYSVRKLKRGDEIEVSSLDDNDWALL